MILGTDSEIVRVVAGMLCLLQCDIAGERMLAIAERIEAKEACGEWCDGDPRDGYLGGK